MEASLIDEDLNNVDSWEYYNEGNNNIILIYTGKNPLLSQKVLRIRKNTNYEFYADPCLLPEQEYNKLMIENVFMSDPIMGLYLQDMHHIQLKEEFLKALDAKIKDRNKVKVRVESGIDYHRPIAMLTTNFSSHHEIVDD